MNLRGVAWLLGGVLAVVAAAMLVPAVVCAWFGEAAEFEAFLVSALVAAGPAGLLLFFFRGSTVGEHGRTELFRREGIAAVALAWVVASLFGAVPFVLTGALPSPVDAFFESASGLTTTGATVLRGADFAATSRGVLFWRATSEWIGGLATLVVFVVLFPGGRSDSPRLEGGREGIQRRVRDAAFEISRVYVGLTIVLALGLLMVGMSAFDAIVHALGILSTGGFSSRAESIGAFGSWLVELAVIVAMFTAAVDYSVFESLFRGGVARAWRTARASSELRAYVLLVLFAAATFTVVLWAWGGSNGDPASDLPDYRSFLSAARDGTFATVSLQSSSGYVTADFDRWPDFLRVVALILVSVGGCSGSTAGGLKVVRLLLLVRVALQGFLRFARPRTIHTVRIDAGAVGESVSGRALGYFSLWFLVFLAGTFALAALLSLSSEFRADEVPVTAVAGVLSALSNVGPALDGLGPHAGLAGAAGGYAALPGAAKLLLAGLMIVGRVEIYAIGVLFLPRFWRK